MKLFVLLFQMVLFASSVFAENICFNKTVTVNGSAVVSNGPAVVDGIFLPNGVWWLDVPQWENQTVSWRDANTTITINLIHPYQINSIIVQADDNDTYLFEYLDINGLWNPLWIVPNYYIPYGDGIRTRPTPTDNADPYMLPNSVTTTELRFSAIAGDGYYAVSEIQAFPEPMSLLLFALLAVPVLKISRTN